MRWLKATLLHSVETGTDKLGNPIKVDKEVQTVDVRMAPWSLDDVALEGREITETNEKIVCRIRYESFPECDKVCIDGKIYHINGIRRHEARYVALTARNQKKESYVKTS